GYWNSWGYSDGFVRLQEKSLEAEGNFTSSYFSTQIAASPVLPVIPPRWHAIFKWRRANSNQKRSLILAQRSPSTLLSSARFQRCRAVGLSPASSMTCRPDLLR